MDVILTLSNPRVELKVERGSRVTRDEIFKLSGLYARDSAGNSLMGQLHLGDGGVQDDGITVTESNEVDVTAYFEVAGKFYNTGKVIHLVLDVEELKPEIKSVDIELEEFNLQKLEDIAAPIETVSKPDVKSESEIDAAKVPDGLHLIKMDGGMLTYEWELRLGDNPGEYQVPPVDRVLEVPEGKKLVSAQLVVYPTMANGEPIESMELAEGAEFQDAHITWTPSFGDMLLPFGMDDGSNVYGLWYGVIATVEDLPKPKDEPKTAWGRVPTQPSKRLSPALNSEESEFEIGKSDEVGPVLIQDDVEIVEIGDHIDKSGIKIGGSELSDDGIGDIWKDSEPTNLINHGATELAGLDLEQPVVGQTRKSSTFDWGSEGREYEQPVLNSGGDGGKEEDMEIPNPQPQSKKAGLFGKKKDRPAPEIKTDKKTRSKQPKAKKTKTKSTGGKGDIIAGVLGLVTVIGLGAGGYIYYQSGVDAAKPLKAEVTKVNKEIADYLNRDTLSSEDTTELAALVQKNDEAFNNFKPKNLFAQNAENELIKETQKLIDEVYAKLNK